MSKLLFPDVQQRTIRRRVRQPAQISFDREFPLFKRMALQLDGCNDRCSAPLLGKEGKKIAVAVSHLAIGKPDIPTQCTSHVENLILTDKKVSIGLTRFGESGFEYVFDKDTRSLLAGLAGAQFIIPGNVMYEPPSGISFSCEKTARACYESGQIQLADASMPLSSDAYAGLQLILHRCRSVPGSLGRISGVLGMAFSIELFPRALEIIETLELAKLVLKGRAPKASDWLATQIRDANGAFGSFAQKIGGFYSGACIKIMRTTMPIVPIFVLTGNAAEFAVNPVLRSARLANTKHCDRL